MVGDKDWEWKQNRRVSESVSGSVNRSGDVSSGESGC